MQAPNLILIVKTVTHTLTPSQVELIRTDLPGTIKSVVPSQTRHETTVYFISSKYNPEHYSAYQSIKTLGEVIIVDSEGSGQCYDSDLSPLPEPTCQALLHLTTLVPYHHNYIVEGPVEIAFLTLHVFYIP